LATNDFILNLDFNSTISQSSEMQSTFLKHIQHVLINKKLPPQAKL